MIDLEDLRAFYYVIREGSIVKAAQVLNRSYVAVARHLNSLEDTYKVKLYTKVRKRFELTEEGKNLFKVLQSSLPNLEIGAASILNTSPEENTLRILTTTGIIGIWLIRKIKEFIEECPDVSIAVMTTNADVDFEASRADVAIFAKQSTPGLSQKKVRTLHAHLFASADYLKKYGRPKNYEELSHHKLISFYADYEGNIGNIDWHLTRDMPEYTLRKSYLSINSGFVIFEAACQGLGIISIAEEFEYIPSSNLEKVFPHDQGQPIDVYYITRANQVLTGVQKIFFEILMK